MTTRCQKLHDYRLRLCILQDVHDGKTIKEAYKHFCEVKGENAMEYTEFDFWYYHFYNGNDDLNFNRDQNPKRPTFSDLPTKIVKKLVDDLGPIDQLVLRKVSHYLQDIVDDKTMTCHRMVFSCYENSATFYLDDTAMHFAPKERGCKSVYNAGKGRRWKAFENGGNFLKMAMNEFLVIMKNPKLQLNEITIGFHVPSETEEGMQLSKKYLGFIESELKTLKHLIPVKSVLFVVDRLESVLSFLPYFKAGTLESLDLYSVIREENETVINNLRTLDQWKQAAQFKGFNFSVPIEHVFYFTHFSGSVKSISNNDFINMRDVLLRTSNIKSYFLKSEKKFDIKEMEKIFGAVRDENDGSFWYTVHGTDKVFQFSVMKCDTLSIKKRSHN